jgi:glutamyl-tRNA synthetase
MTNPVRVRFAPSPTGYFHIGGARSALFNWLYARHTGGTFIIRVEDTDRARYKKFALRDLLEGLRWLGMDWDEGPEVGGEHAPYFQTQRVEIYREYARNLVESGAAYYCYCSSERLSQLREEQQKKKEPIGYDRQCRNLSDEERAEYEAQGITPVVRLKVPLEGSMTFHDVLHGDITVDFDSLRDDKVLLKSDGFPTYSLAAPVDDTLMGITHTMRAAEWLPSTPYHILLFKALGWKPPIYVHLPMVLAPSGKGKLSKRHGAVSVLEFKRQGYLPEAMINYLARTGWAYDDKTEVFSRDELVAAFDLGGISNSPARFSYEKLDWLNGLYIRELAPEDLAQRLLPFLREAGLDADLELTKRLVPLIQERLKKLSDAIEWVDFFFVDEITYDPADLVQKKSDAGEVGAILEAAIAALSAVDAFEDEPVEAAMRGLVDATGLKARTVFGTLRIALTGKRVAPPLFESVSIIGKDKVLARLEKALELAKEL